MQKRIMAFMKEHHMAEEGDCILAAVSGGADSVCLLLILQELAQAGKIRLCAVHVEHGIRGEDSRKDACFVEEICRQHRIPCKIFHCQAMEYARAHKMTVEEGARILRYGFFEQAAEIFRADRIAVAHNQNDCAETILFHLARGTGLKGLCGIPPVRDNIIRPLLCVKRREIEAFLAAEGQIFCQDKTNETLDYTRNRVRHQILPVLEEINSEAVAHMNQAAEQAAELTYTMGSYTGNGSTQNIHLGFRPRFVIIFGDQSSSLSNGSPTYVAIASEQISSQRLFMTDEGFRVVKVGESNRTFPRANDSGIYYNFIAFR